MKANELTIGDWVSLPNCEHIKVDAVHRRKIGVHHRKDKLQWYFEGSINPIPLTKEILEKNFGQRRGKGGVFFHFIGSNGICDYIIEYYKEDFGFCRDHGGLLCRIKYVHQLQHLLRLCEIEDLKL